jgi:hypothetical protein
MHHEIEDTMPYSPNNKMPTIINGTPSKGLAKAKV